MLASGRWLRHLMVLLGIVLVASCASKPPPLPPTVVKVTIEALPNINPDIRGRPSPVVVRFYELKSLAVFETGDFFSLFDRGREVLGGDLVTRDEFELLPGGRKEFERTLPADAHFLGVVVAFRDLDHAVWRATVPVTPNQTSLLTIKLDGQRVVMGASR